MAKDSKCCGLPRRGHYLAFRLAGLVIAQIFLLTSLDISWAAPQRSFFSKRNISQIQTSGRTAANPTDIQHRNDSSYSRIASAHGAGPLPLDPASVDLPAELGRVVERQIFPGSSQVVVYIQDVHAHPEAQENIAQILKYLNQAHGVKQVALEGSAGPILTFFFSSIPDGGVRQRWAEQALNQAIITGPEKASIAWQLPLDLYGVENREQYIEDYLYFRQMHTVPAEWVADMEALSAQVEAIQEATLSPKALELLRAIAGRATAEGSMTEYVRLLSGLAGAMGLDLESQYPAVWAFAQVQKLQPELEAALYKEETRSLLARLIKARAGEEGVQDLMKAAAGAAGGRLAAGELAVVLQDWIAEEGLAPSEYPQILKAAEFHRLSEKLQPEQVLAQSQELEARVLAGLLRSEEEQQVYALGQNVGLLMSVLEGDAAPEEWRKYQEKRAQLDPGQLCKTAETLAQRCGVELSKTVCEQALTAWKSWADGAEGFYQVAEARNESLVSNTLAWMKEGDAVLLTGGFHTEGITELLARRGISYVVVAPRVTQFAGPDLYLERMLAYDVGAAKPQNTFASVARADSLATMHLLAANPALDPEGFAGIIRQQAEVVLEMFGELSQTQRAIRLREWHGLLRERIAADANSSRPYFTDPQIIPRYLQILSQLETELWGLPQQLESAGENSASVPENGRHPLILDGHPELLNAPEPASLPGGLFAELQGLLGSDLTRESLQVLLDNLIFGGVKEPEQGQHSESANSAVDLLQAAETLGESVRLMSALSEAELQATSLLVKYLSGDSDSSALLALIDLVRTINQSLYSDALTKEFSAEAQALIIDFVWSHYPEFSELTNAAVFDELDRRLQETSDPTIEAVQDALFSGTRLLDLVGEGTEEEMGGKVESYWDKVLGDERLAKFAPPRQRETELDPEWQDLLDSLAGHLRDSQILTDPMALLQVYNQDLAKMPSAFNLVYDTKPDAAVRVRSEDDLIRIVQFARAHHINLIPRGRASAALGGAIPTDPSKRNLVLDLFELNSIKVEAIQIEPGQSDRMILTVGPTATFDVIQAKLDEHNRAVVDDAVEEIMRNVVGVGLSTPAGQAFKETYGLDYAAVEELLKQYVRQKKKLDDGLNNFILALQGGPASLKRLDAIRDQELHRLSLDNHCPSNPAGGVAGWISNGEPGVGGLGINNYRYGSALQAIESMRVLTGAGKIEELKRGDPRLQDFVGTGGRFGIILEVQLRLHRMQGASPRLARFESGEEAMAFVQEVTKKPGMDPTHVMYEQHHGESGPEHQVLLNFDDAEQAQQFDEYFEDYAKSPRIRKVSFWAALKGALTQPGLRKIGALGDHFLYFVFKHQNSVRHERIAGYAGITPRIASPTLAGWQEAFDKWDERLRPMKARNLGDMYTSEVVMPLDRVSGYLGQVNRMTRGLRTLRRLPRAPAAPDLGVELDTLAVAEHILSQPLPILESDSALNGLKASLKITLEFLQTPLHRQSPNWRQDQLSLLNRQIELYRKAELLAVAQISESQEIPVSPGSDVLVGKQRAIQNILEELRALPREGKSNFRPERRGELMLRLEEELDSYSILRSEVTGQTRDWAPLLRRVPEVTVEKMDAQEIEAVLPRAARRGRKFFGRSRQADLRIRVNDATQIDFIVRTAQRFGRPVVLSTNPQASMGQAVSGREYLLIDVSQISEIGNPDELIQGLVRYNETLERPQHLEIHGKAYVTAVHDAAGNVTGYEAMVSPEFLSDSRDFLSFHMDAVITKVNMLAAVLFHEARPYGHGLFFTDFLRRALGQEHMHRLQNARKEYDPDNIMNPGKVTEMKTRGRNLPSRFAFGPLGWTLMTAYRFTVMLAPVRNSVIRTIDWSRRVGGKELVRYVEELWAEQETCIRCSACTTVCPIAQIMMNSRDPWLMKRAFDVTPEGRLRLMRKHLSGQKLTFDELFSFVACLRCGVAEQEHICPIGDQLLANYGEVLGVGESKELVAYDALEQQLRAEGYPVDDAIRLFGDALRNHPGVQMAMEDLYGARGTPVDPSSSIHAPPLSQFPQWQVHVDESICINCTLCGIDDPKVAERIQHPEDPDRRKMVTLDELLRATGGRIPARWFKKHGGTLPNNLPQVRNGERSLESVGRGMVQNVRRNGNTVEMDVFVEQGHVARAGFVRDWRENAWQTSQDEVKGLVQEVGRVTVSGMQIDEEDGNVVLDVELENGRLAWGTFLEIGEGRAVRIAEIRQPKNRGQGFVEVEEVFSREQGTVRAQVVLEGVSVEELAALRGDSVRVLQRNERKHVRRLSTVGIQGAEGSVPLVRRYKGAAAVATVSFNVSADQDLPYQTGDSVEFFEEVTQVEAQSGDVGCTACQKCAKNCPAGTVHGLPHGAIHIEPDEYFLELWGADYEPAEIARITEEANSITSLKSGMGTASVHARVRTTAWRRWLMRDREVEIPFSAREQHLRLAAGLNPAEVDEAPPVNERWAGLNRFVFDLSVIVRPTRDGLRESISFRLSLGRRLAFQVYDRLRQILGGRFPGMITRMQGVHLNMPLLFEVPVIEGTRSADGTGLAQQRTGEVAEIMARSAYLEGSLVLIEIEDFIRNYEALMPYAENISLRVRGGSLGRALDEVRKRQNDFPGFDTVLAKLPMIEIVDDDQYGEDSQRSVAEVLNQAKALQRIVRGFPAEAEVSPARLPQISILLQPRVGTDHEMIAQRALAFANAGADILHIKSPFNAAATDYETARLIPTVYEALKSEGRHQQVPIIASGGIKQAADIGVTMMLGATAVVADRTPLVALDHEMPRLDREGRERIEPFNIDEGVERLHNLTHSWLDQFQEVLGAFGVRDVRRIVGDRGRLIDLREQELKLHDTVTNPDHAKRSQKVNAALLEAEGELMRANTWTARGLLRLVRSVAEPEERLTVGWGEAFRVVHELKGDKRWTKDLLQSWYKLASGEWTYAQLRDRYGTERVDTGQDIGAGSLDNLQWVRVQRTDGEGVSLGRSVSLEELSAERRLQFVNPETGLIDIDAYAEWIDGQKRMEGDRREPKPVNLSPGWENQHAQPKEVVKNGETVREPAEKIVPRSILHFADMSVGSIGYKLWFARNLAAAILQAHMGSGEGGLLQSLPNVFSTRVVPGFQKNTRLIQYLLRRSGRWIATQVATGFFGVKEDTLAEDYDVLVLDENTWSQFKDLDELAHRIRTAKEVVIKYGQGAKPGLGGKLPGSKNREPVSTYRGTSEGIDLDSPFPFHNVYSIEDHRKHVDWFRALNPQIVVTGKIPTPVDTYHVCKGMVEAGVDVIQIDGTAGGTGAAPQIAKDRIAMALEQAVVDAHRFLVQQGVRNTVKIRASGGLRTSQDVLKIIALGADEVMLGTGEIVAVGCNRCTDCTKGCDIAIANSNQLVESQRDLFATTQNIINGQSQVLFDVAASLQEMYQAGLITEPSTAALRGRWDLIDPDSWGWTEDWTGISPADREAIRLREEAERLRDACGVTAIAATVKVAISAIQKACRSMTNRGNGEGGGVMALGGVYPGHEERFALHLQVLVEEGQRPARALEALQRYYAGFEIYVRTEPNGTPKNVNELTEEDVERLLRFPRKQQDGRDITYQEANMEHDPGDMFVPFLRARKDALIEFAQELLEQSRLSDEDQGRLDLVNEAAEEYGALMRPVLDLRKQAAELRAKAEAAAKQGDGATETEALQEEIIILRSLKAYQEEHGDQLDELREVLEHRWTEFLGMVKAQGKWIPYLTEYSGILTGDYLKNVSEEHIESLMQDVKTKQQALSDFSEEFARTQFDKGPEEVSKKEFLEALRRPGNEEALERYLGLEAALRVALENEEYRLWVALEDEMVYKTNDRLNKRYYVNATREKLVGFAQSVTRGNEWPSELPAEFLNGIPADKQTEAVKLYQELCERFELSGVQDYLGEFEGEYSFEDEERMDQRERSYRNRDWIGFWRAVEKLYDSTHEKPASLPEMFVASSMKDGGVWKVLGYAHDVPDYWDIPDSFVQIGHQRYPTVFSLHPGGAHPFAELLDALIHNGDFATYVANVAHWMVYGRSPSFGTDTEAASIAYHILKHTLGYMPHIVFEALAPTTGLDLERLQRISPELAEQFEALAETHIAGSPDGPWFFIIGSEGWDEHGKPTYELTGVTDTSVLRPSVFTVWQFEDISIAMIGSEFQAMMEAAQQLYEDGVIPTPIPDNITIVRGGSVELKVVSEGTPGAYEIADGLFVRAADGGTRSFVIEESPTGKKDFVIKDKFGEIVLAVAPAADLEADIVVGQVPIEVAEFFNIKDLWTGIPSDIISFIQDRLPDWDYNTFRWVVLRLVELAQEDRNRTAVQRVLNELHDQLPYQQINAEEGPQKRRSSLAQVIREGLDRIFESVKSVAEEASREDQYRKVDFDTQTLMPEPEAFDQVLVIDAKGFPHEIDHDAWKDLQEEAAEAGWGEERLISEAAARLPASLSRMVVRAYRAGWRHLSITNLSGHRFIGTGVGPGSWELNIDLYGAPGQNLGTGSMGISFHPHAYYVQDDTFLNATGGYLAVPGSVGTTLGFAMQGATMVIGGDVHSRAFIQSTSRPGGQGYRVGILGRPYEFVGESLMGADLLMWMGLETDGNGGLTRRYYPYEGQDIAPGASLGNLLIYDPDDRLRAFHIEVNGQELILDRQQLESLDADNWPEALEGILSFEEWSSIQVVGIPAGTAGIREPLYLESVLLAEESLPLSLVGVLTSNQWQQIRAADEYQVGAWPVLSPREFLVLLTQESVEFALSPERLIRLWSDGPQYPMARRVPVDDTTWMEANRMFLLMNQEFGLRGEFVDKSGEVVPSRVWVGSEYELLRFAQTLVEEITSGRGPSDWPGQMERAVEDYAKALVGITDQTDDPEKIQAALAGPTQQLRKAFGFLIAPGVLDQLLVQNLDLQLSLLHQVHDSLQELLDVFDANGLDSYLTQVWHNPELREHYDYRGFWNLIHTLYSVGQPPLHSEARRCEVRVDGVWKELEASDLAGCESATGTSALLRFHLVVDGEAQILTKENFTQLRPMQGADRTKLKHRQAEAKKRANDYRVQDLRQRVEARDPVDMGDLFGEILKVDLPEVPPPPPVGALLRQQRELVAESLDQLGMLESAL